MALTDNLVAYWSLDESSGTLADSTGNGHGLTTTGSPTYSVSGKVNTGVQFASASSQYATGDVSAAFDLATNYTVSCWIKRTSTGAFHGLVSKDTHLAGWTFYIHSNNTLHMVHQGKADVGAATALSSTGVWYHAAVTNNAGAVTFYVNGVSDGTGTLSTITAASSEPVRIACNKDSALQLYLNGTLDEIGYWSRALTGAEIASLYNGGAGLAYPFSSFIAAQNRRLFQAINRASNY